MEGGGGEKKDPRRERNRPAETNNGTAQHSFPFSTVAKWENILFFLLYYVTVQKKKRSSYTQ
jgi:hypothetical protein